MLADLHIAGAQPKALDERAAWDGSFVFMVEYPRYSGDSPSMLGTPNSSTFSNTIVRF